MKVDVSFSFISVIIMLTLHLCTFLFYFIPFYLFIFLLLFLLEFLWSMVFPSCLILLRKYFYNNIFFFVLFHMCWLLRFICVQIKHYWNHHHNNQHFHCKGPSSTVRFTVNIFCPYWPVVCMSVQVFLWEILRFFKVNTSLLFLLPLCFGP